MRRFLVLFPLVVTLAACTGGPVAKDVDPNDTAGETGDDTGPEPDPDPMVTGNLDTRDGVHTGTVSLVRAFSFYNELATLLYASSNPDATCETVAVTLGVEGEYDPNDLFLPGHCNIDLQLTSGPPLETYDLQTDLGAIVRARCAYGEGEWEYKNGSLGMGWYWSGDLFTPSAWKGTFSIAVRNEESRGLDVEMDLKEWRGTFPHDPDDPDDHLASGRIEGTLSTVNCGALAETAWF
jgi:hypothetical protein